MTRIWSWLGACSILTAGCRFVVSLDGLAGPSPTAAGDGGSAGSGGGASGASGSSGSGGTGGFDASDDGGAVSDGAMDVERAIDGPANGPIPIHSVPPGATIRGIAVYGANLYWVEAGSGRGVFRMAKDGSEAPVLLHLTATATDVAADGAFVYWGDGYEVFQMPASGTRLTQPVPYVSLGATTTRYLAVDDMAAVYVTSAGLIVSGTPMSTGVPYRDQVGLSGIAFYTVPDAGLRDLLWGYGAGVREGSTLGGGSGVDLYTGSNEPVQGIATDGQYMYWISSGRTIKRGTLGSAPGVSDRCFNTPQDFAGDAGTDGGNDLFADIAVDERWIYFTWPAKNQIWKCAKD